MLKQAATHLLDRHTCIHFYCLLFVFQCPTGDKGLVLHTERSQAHLLSVRDCAAQEVAGETYGCNLQ